MVNLWKVLCHRIAHFTVDTIERGSKYLLQSEKSSIFSIMILTLRVRRRLSVIAEVAYKNS
jgi:hypothetical protein